MAFPENTPYYGNVLIYQLNVRENHENWISDLCAQTNKKQQVITPLIILSTPTTYYIPHSQNTNNTNIFPHWHIHL